jgi:hypothetical protein
MCNCVLTVLHLLTYLCSQAMLEGRGSLLWNCIMRWVQEAMPSQAAFQNLSLVDILQVSCGPSMDGGAVKSGLLKRAFEGKNVSDVTVRAAASYI